MKGEKEFYYKPGPPTAEEEKLQPAIALLFYVIGSVLRRAAGLSEEEDPFIERSDEAHLPHLGRLVAGVLLARTGGPRWYNPRAVEAELEKVRRDIKRLQNRIASLDYHTRSIIDTAGDTDPGEGDDGWHYLSVPEADHVTSDIVSWLSIPHESQKIRTTLSAMKRLDAAIVSVIERTIEESALLKETGRMRGYHKNTVALIVAQYLYSVTGKIPALTTRPTLSGPFALALQDIFEILYLPKGVQRPGEYAISELTSKLSKNLSFDT